MWVLFGYKIEVPKLGQLMNFFHIKNYGMNQNKIIIIKHLHIYIEREKRKLKTFIHIYICLGWG